MQGLFIFFVLTFYVFNLSANQFSFEGYDVESASVLNSNVAYGRSVGVLYTNPALIGSIKNQLSVNLNLNFPNMKIRLMDKPYHSDVPISIYDSNVGNFKNNFKTLPTVELINRRSDTIVDDSTTFIGIGLAYNFNIPKFQLAGIIQLPISFPEAAVLSTHYNDEREAIFSNRLYFTRFGQWEKIAAGIAGASYEILPQFILGMAAQITITTKTHLSIYIPDASVQDYSLANADAKISTGIRPILGMILRPIDWLSVGVVFRDESWVEVAGTGELLLWNYHEADPYKTIPKRAIQSFPMAIAYEPREYQIGAGLKASRLTTQLAVMYQEWPLYRDHHNKHPFILDNPMDSKTEKKFHFNGTFNYLGSVSYEYSDKKTFRFGFAYYPTPVPPQIGRTNFVDNDLIAASIGYKYDFRLLNREFTFNTMAQVFYMAKRITYKDPTLILDEFPDDSTTLLSNSPMLEAKGLQTNNPGFPGYEAGGYLLSVGANLIYYF
ncbi:MAG: outer membrane protein transport protein [Deltaproteobacteria bacterium]|nr:outer membrane protein transport protein [Deltaproteobacteria bacterium]